MLLFSWARSARNHRTQEQLTERRQKNQTSSTSEPRTPLYTFGRPPLPGRLGAHPSIDLRSSVLLSRTLWSATSVNDPRSRSTAHGSASLAQLLPGLRPTQPHRRAISHEGRRSGSALGEPEHRLEHSPGRPLRRNRSTWKSPAPARPPARPTCGPHRAPSREGRQGVGRRQQPRQEHANRAEPIAQPARDAAHKRYTTGTRRSRGADVPPLGNNATKYGGHPPQPAPPGKKVRQCIENPARRCVRSTSRRPPPSWRGAQPQSPAARKSTDAFAAQYAQSATGPPPLPSSGRRASSAGRQAGLAGAGNVPSVLRALEPRPDGAAGQRPRDERKACEPPGRITPTDLRLAEIVPEAAPAAPEQTKLGETILRRPSAGRGPTSG